MYKVNLDVFEGPFDLLLHLIKKNEVDILDIPIAPITAEYLQVLEQMRETDVNMAGEFLIMAAQLLWIKSRMLLPPDPVEGVEAGEEDPRAELVRQLLEYRQYKEAAEEMQRMELKQRDVFTRFSPDTTRDLSALSTENIPLEVNLYDLLKAFEKILANLPEETVREIEREEVSVVQKMNEILDLLENQDSIAFFEAFANLTTKTAVIATFLAILELSRLRSVRVRQAQRFGEIRLYKVNPEASLPAADAAAPNPAAADQKSDDSEDKTSDHSAPPGEPAQGQQENPAT